MLAPDRNSRIAANLQTVIRRIERAAARAGRDPASVRLLAVTKYVGLPEIRALAARGVRDIGESRVQDLVERAEAFGAPISWHLIGHLQRNKVRKVLPYVAAIHSVDSVQLGETIARIAREEGPARATIPLPVFLQVNVSGESTKHGFVPEDLCAALDALRGKPELAVRGLMTMLPYDAPEDRQRAWFRRVRALADAQGLPECSMGMSHDFEAAVEEGATVVRVGSALFE